MVRMMTRLFLLDLILYIISVLAASSIANIVKSSLGPVGLDKMLVDEIGVSVVESFKETLMFNIECRMLPLPTMEQPSFSYLKSNTPQEKY